MNTQDTIQIRVDKKTKEAARKTLEGLGLDMSSAIKLFLNQIVIEQGLPFKPSRTPQQIKRELDAEVADALAHGKRYTSVSELFKDLESD